MGKRELVIALAFVVVGVCAYQFSAAPEKTSTGGFSFSKLIDNMRRGMRGNQSYAAPPRTLTFPVDNAVTELRLEGVNSTIKIVGDTRPDVSMDLAVSSTGETETAALAIAARVQVLVDRVGDAMVLRLDFPSEESQVAIVTLKIPSRLAVRLDAPRDPVVSHVRSLQFASPARGAAELTDIPEGIRGDQSSGQLTIKGAGALKMKLTRVRARISGLTMGAALEVQDGETDIQESRGALEFDTRRGNIEVRDQKGTVKIAGSGGQVRIESANDEVHLDLTRADVDVELHAGSAGSIVTSTSTMRVTLPEPAGVRVEAITTNGNVDASAWHLTAVKTGDDSRLTESIGTKSADAPLVSLRNQGADIILKKSSKK